MRGWVVPHGAPLWFDPCHPAAMKNRERVVPTGSGGFYFPKELLDFGFRPRSWLLLRTITRKLPAPTSTGCRLTCCCRQRREPTPSLSTHSIRASRATEYPLVLRTANTGTGFSSQEC